MSEKARVRRATPRESEEVVNEYEPAGTMLPGDIQPPASLQRPPRESDPGRMGRAYGNRQRRVGLYRTPESDPNDPVAKRIAEMRERRRERKSQDVSGLSFRLDVPEEHRDPRFVYRWVSDTETRHYRMLQRDWEYVENGELAADPRNSGVGSSKVERIVDERTVNKPQKAFLMRKPREFYEEDKLKEQERIAQNEEGIRRGVARNEQGGQEPGMYVPSSGMSINRG